MKPVLLFLSISFLVACKKDSNVYKLDENLAKRELESLVQLNEVEKSEREEFRSSGKDLKFKSFREAYRFFRAIIDRGPQIMYDSLLPESNLALAESSQSIIANNSTSVHYVNYSGPINSSSNLAFTFGASGSAVASYIVNATVGYAYYTSNNQRVYTSKNFVSNSASALAIFYQGVGTGSATNGTFYSFTHDSGYYYGNLQGQMTIEGYSYSFVFNLSGYYHLQPPVNNEPAPTLIISHALQASSPIN